MNYAMQSHLLDPKMNIWYKHVRNNNVGSTFLMSLKGQVYA